MGSLLRAAAGLVLVAALLLPITVSAASEGLRANITVAAVSEPEFRGVLIPVSIIIKPGHGEVNVRSGGPVGDTTRSSLEQAAILGAVLAGYDWRRLDYTIVFHNASRVEGPSASAAVATTIYLMLTGSPSVSILENRSVMTGAISPVGLFSPVGGVEEKCAAAVQAGRSFFYPLSNYQPSLSKCGNATALAGILSAAEALTGLRINAEPAKISMPPEFNDTMRSAAINMSRVARSVLARYSNSSLGPGLARVLAEAERALNMSAENLDSHPYASASFAFTALYKAFYIDYAARLLAPGQTGGFLTLVRKEAGMLMANLTRLESRLASMPASGSAYYIEFLGTAYTRIADAESSLAQIDVLAEESPQAAIDSLAYARARIYSVESWMRAAESVRGLEPYLSSEQIYTMNSVVGDYAHIATDYALSIARYMLESAKAQKGYPVDTRLLERSIDVLLSIIHRGDNYTAQGNPIAALGFYRDALDKSMNRIFSIVLANESSLPLVYRGYMEEAYKLYNYIAARLAWSGFPPGLAPAYMDYAILLYEKYNETEAALDIARNALASAVTWYLYVESSRPAAAMQSPAPPLGVPAAGGGATGLIVLALVTGFALGFAAVSLLVSRLLTSRPGVEVV